MNFFDKKTILLLILFLGILFIAIDITSSYSNCNNRRIVYRYIPRNLNGTLDNEVPVTKIFEKMFTQPSPWVSGMSTFDGRKLDQINNFFISQN